MTRTTTPLSGTTAALIVGFAVSLGAMAHVQEPAPAEGQKPPESPATPTEPSKPSAPSRQERSPRGAVPRVTSNSRNVTVEVIVMQQLGGAPVSKTLKFVVADNSTGKVRSGIQVPVMGSGNGAFQQVEYRPVGFDVDAGVRILENDKIWLDVRLNFSSVLPPATAADASEPGRPSFGNAHSELNLLLDNGVAVSLTEAGDPSTGQDYSVQVKATIVE